MPYFFLLTGNDAICVLADIYQAATDFGKLLPINCCKKRKQNVLRDLSPRHPHFVLIEIHFTHQKNETPAHSKRSSRKCHTYTQSWKANRKLSYFLRLVLLTVGLCLWFMRSSLSLEALLSFHCLVFYISYASVKLLYIHFKWNSLSK